MPTVQASPSNSFPAFPDHIINGIAKEFVDLYTPIREVPPQFLWLAFITYLGNSISKFVRLSVDYSEPRLFCVAIGRSARTKKSTGNNLARDLFRSVSGDSQHIVEGFGSAEGLLADLSKRSGIPTLVHLDEINILAQKTGIDGSVGISALHKLFEDHDYDHTLAQDKGYRVKGAYLSLQGASTLDDFLKTWKGRHADAGFFSRLFFVGAERPMRRIALPVRVDPAQREALVNQTKELITALEAAYKANQTAPVEYMLDADAKAVWCRFYESFGDGKEWDRIDTYGFRLMVIMAVLRGQQRITKQITEQVVELLRYEVAVRRIVQPVIADNALAEMEQMIMRSLPLDGTPITRRELYRKTHADRKGPTAFNQAIQNLVNDHQVIVHSVKNSSGKESPCYARVLDDEDVTNVVTESVVTAEGSHNARFSGEQKPVSPVPMAPPAQSVGMQWVV